MIESPSSIVRCLWGELFTYSYFRPEPWGRTFPAWWHPAPRASAWRLLLLHFTDEILPADGSSLCSRNGHLTGKAEDKPVFDLDTSTRPATPCSAPTRCGILGTAPGQGQQHGLAGWQSGVPRAGLSARSGVPAAARLVCQHYETHRKVQACNFCREDILSDLALSFFSFSFSSFFFLVFGSTTCCSCSLFSWCLESCYGAMSCLQKSWQIAPVSLPVRFNHCKPRGMVFMWVTDLEAWRHWRKPEGWWTAV